MAQKKCPICRKKISRLDFRAPGILAHFISNWGKIKSGSDTGMCSRHQRTLAQTLKRARFMGLLPYTNR